MGTIPLLNSDSTLLVTNRSILNKGTNEIIPKSEKHEDYKVSITKGLLLVRNQRENAFRVSVLTGLAYTFPLFELF